MSIPIWYVYMIETERGQLYTGITTDPLRRYREHAEGRGARFFRSVRPRGIVFCRTVLDRAEASSLEMKIKRMEHIQKDRLVKEARTVTERVLAELAAAVD